MKNFSVDESLAADRSRAMIYPDCIPPFAERSLERLYGSLYASMPQLRCDRLDRINTYAAWRGSQLSALLLYRLDGSRISVINEGMGVSTEELNRFAAALFERHANASVISFYALAVDKERLDYPSIRMPVTEDILIDLPGSGQDYLSQLSKSSRKSIKQHLSRAQRDLADFDHAVLTGNEISDDLVDQVIAFNHRRMASKQRRSAIDAEARSHLLHLLRHRGWVGVVRSEGRICAGTLACRLGDDVYSLVNAHDPDLDAYSLGNVSRHLLINASIHAGVRRFHMMGGQLSTKRHAMARRHVLCELRLYRSWRSVVRDTLGLLRLSRASLMYRLRTWLEDLPNSRSGYDTLTNILLFLQKTWRSIRRRLQWR